MSFVPYQRGGMLGIVPYRRGGMRGLGDSNINPTTIWTPSTGFLATTGVTTPGAPSAGYQAPALVPVPACSQDTRPGGAAFSSACIAQVLAAQQQNLQLLNDANYTVDLTNCNNDWALNDSRYAALGLPRPPNTCGTRTFGLTPTGGYTSNAQVGGGQLIEDAAGNIVGTPPTVHGDTPNPYVAAPTPKLVVPTSTPATTTPTTGGGGSSSASTVNNYVAQGTDFLTQDVAVAGLNLPIWGIAAAGVALLFFMGGKH